jgi:dihydrofolate synthase/folylpolyglutamate synthase
MKYEECLKKIFKWNMFRNIPSKPMEGRARLTLDPMRFLANQFGNPQDSFKTIHIAGTNGKGSVSIKCARALESAGYKTGLFISPHISSFRERMSVNSKMISLV